MQVIKKFQVFSGVAALFLAACSHVSPSAEMPSVSVRMEKQQNAAVDPVTQHYKGQVQIQLQDGLLLEDFVQTMFDQEGIALRALDQIRGRNIYLMEYDQRLREQTVLQSLRSRSEIIRAAANVHIQLNHVNHNDPRVMKQWSFYNAGQDAPQAIGGRRGADIDIHGVPTPGSKNVVVAIVDTGIDYLHEDLAVTEVVNGRRVPIPEKSNIWVNPYEIPGNGLNDDNNGGVTGGYIDDVYGYDFVSWNGDPMDDHGHGTHIAGVIGALRNNFVGISGMNAEVSMMAVRFLGSSGGGSLFGAQQAIYYVKEMAERHPEKRFIMNCSWGSGSRGSEGEHDDFLLLAFEEAAEAGVLTFAAAGNDSISNSFSDSFPANYSEVLPEVVSVAATNNLDQLADFSSYSHRNVQVAAPGVLIYSTLPGNRYAAWSGTSMATPHVAGLAALIWAQEPELSALEVRDRILNTVDVLPQLQGFVSTGGRINVRRALENDVNVSTQPVWEEISRVVESPRIHRMGVDAVVKIQEEGARKIKVCFDQIRLDWDFEWLQIYGSDYRVRDLITGLHLSRNLRSGEMRREVCSAPVPGDTAHIRMYADSGSQFGLNGFRTRSVRVLR